MAHFCRVAQAIGQAGAWTGRSVESAALACRAAQGGALLRTQRRVAPHEDVPLVVVSSCLLGFVSAVADCYPHQSGGRSAILMRLPMT